MNSIELRKLLDDDNFTLFNFDYIFYNNSADDKKLFEETFIDYYFFYLIGFESVARFKHSLRSKLNILASKYRQLYESELKSKNIDFLLNKDYTETYTREMDRINNEKTNENNDINKNTTTSVDTNNTSKSDVIQNGTNTNNSKNSDIESGVAEAILSQGFLTGVGENKDMSNSNTLATGNDINKSTGVSKDFINNTLTGDKNITGKDKENYTLTGKGNIGITSSASLLKDWREVMININEMLILECRDLFMLIY